MASTCLVPKSPGAGCASPPSLLGWEPGAHGATPPPPQTVLQLAQRGSAQPHPPGVPQPPCSVPALAMMTSHLGPAVEPISLHSLSGSPARSSLPPRCRDTCSCRVPSPWGSNLGAGAQLRCSSFHGCLGGSARLSSAPASSQQQHCLCPDPVRLYLCSRRHAGCSQGSHWC